MRLSKENKRLLSDEFAFVIKKMESSKDPDEMLYYFTGIYGIIKRIFNLEFSSDLVFSHFIMEKAYHTIIERLGAVKAGHGVATFHENFGQKLIDYTKELNDGFFNQKQRLEALDKIVMLSYSTTGNGYYLIQRGMIDIFSDGKQIENK